MRHLAKTLVFCLLASLASVALASTPDGQTPAVEEVCDLESGAAFGLCNAYCEAMDCDCPTAANPTCEPHASERACARVLDKFMQITGREMPCDLVDTEPTPTEPEPEPEPELQPEACPCIGFSPGWNDPNAISGNWTFFSTAGALSPGAICSDDGTRIVLSDPVVDSGFAAGSAAVDTNLLRCELTFSYSGSAICGNLTPGQALGCRLELLSAWELVHGPGSCS